MRSGELALVCYQSHPLLLRHTTILADRTHWHLCIPNRRQGMLVVSGHATVLGDRAMEAELFDWGSFTS
jgi:hypothetical protein